MDMSSNSQLVKFDTLFLVFYEFEHSFIKLNFWHVTINVGEGGGHPFRDLSLLFMSLFQGGGEGVGQFWTMSLILQFYFFLKSFLMTISFHMIGQSSSIPGYVHFLGPWKWQPDEWILAIHSKFTHLQQHFYCII